ncbi:allantoin racemase [Mameliella alba]|uniref:aspartate/glutamate racemase family protein n=1 Tax=Mameliella alba TaxID=561184 RepID=UPI000891CF28|nr:aspartate/glutamate racemase family protein [Mameliella alba]OWV40211.1 hydantoin racemase [Mameliella alba]PTR32778.1 allantoin racemase [Mameliella alba]GGF86282.1 putative Asp/Glu racemase [Mameliella alba]SDE35546.1 allantoin racemase [Mameliella alba]
MPDPSDSIPARPRVLYQLASPLHLTRGPEVVARRQRMMQAWAPSLQVDIASPETGPAAIESASDAALVFPALRDSAATWAGAGIEAVLIGCFSDPGVDALSEVSGLPVIGPGEAGILAAVQLGERFSVLSSDPTPPGLRRRIRGIGVEGSFVSEVTVGCSVADLNRDPESHMPTVIDRARACVAQGADVLVLGCFALSFTPNLPERLAQTTGVPVVNPVIAGLKAVEAVIQYRAGLPRAETSQLRSAE